MRDQVDALFDRYPVAFRPLRVEPLGGAGGFSGSTLWRLASPAGECCLRRWPVETALARVREIHQVLRQAGRAGLTFVPVPFPNADGETCVFHAGRVWELAPWLPGQANFHREPTDTRLHAAMQALGRFHQAVAPEPAQRIVKQPSPGLQMRLETLQSWLSGDLGRLNQALDNAGPHRLAERAKAVIAQFHSHWPQVDRQLRAVAPVGLELQPCIRDIWHDHVLFTGEQVTGIVDFGAMRLDSVAGDLARLLGSLLFDQPAISHRWQSALAAYHAVRPVVEEEYRVIEAFDAGNALLSGLTWLRWVFLERRSFDDLAAVSRRLDTLLIRMGVLG